MEIDIDPIAEKAIEFFGKEKQIAKALEELGELIAAISKSYNHENNLNIIDEIADVQIMIRQLRSIYGKSQVDGRIEFKMNRLMEKIGLE